MQQSCTGCRTVGWISLIVFAVITIIALIGAYNTHVVAGAFVAGTPEGSFALIVLVLSVHMLVKAFKKACPCGGGCGCGCGCGGSPMKK